MTGWQFKVLRMYNNVSQQTIGRAVGLVKGKTCRMTVYKRENDLKMPETYVKALSDMANVDFIELEKNGELDAYMASIPERFKLKKRLRRYNGYKG